MICEYCGNEWERGKYNAGCISCGAPRAQKKKIVKKQREPQAGYGIAKEDRAVPGVIVSGGGGGGYYSYMNGKMVTEYYIPPGGTINDGEN